jgi:hypothetical protein
MKMNKTCKDCDFWHKTPTSLSTAQCRANSPVPLLIGVNPDMTPIIAAVFPETGQNVWCGKFKEKTDAE